mmetsp:Transcript_121860/g.344649  ORF Transcript_121860/g.344649 Transcript_121860/m.344649 type:complete len:213 (-) Transcript_121860:252-890(-)
MSQLTPPQIEAKSVYMLPSMLPNMVVTLRRSSSLRLRSMPSGGFTTSMAPLVKTTANMYMRPARRTSSQKREAMEPPIIATITRMDERNRTIRKILMMRDMRANLRSLPVELRVSANIASAPKAEMSHNSHHEKVIRITSKSAQPRVSSWQKYSLSAARRAKSSIEKTATKTPSIICKKLYASPPCFMARFICTPITTAFTNTTSMMVKSNA